MKDEVRKELEELKSPLAERKIGVPYSEPQSYFAVLPGNMEALRGKSEENSSLPAAVHPYAAPAGYFRQLPEQVLARVKPPGKNGMLITFGQLRMAAAAVVLLAVGAGAFVRMGENRVRVPDDAMLANVADKDIKAYLGYSRMPVADLSAARYVDNIDVKTEDIERYLDETGWDAEMSF